MKRSIKSCRPFKDQWSAKCVVSAIPYYFEVIEVVKYIYEYKRRWADHIACLGDNRWTHLYPRGLARPIDRRPRRWSVPQFQFGQRWRTDDLHLWQQWWRTIFKVFCLKLLDDRDRQWGTLSGICIESSIQFTFKLVKFPFLCAHLGLPAAHMQQFPSMAEQELSYPTKTNALIQFLITLYQRSICFHSSYLDFSHL